MTAGRERRIRGLWNIVQGAGSTGPEREAARRKLAEFGADLSNPPEYQQDAVRRAPAPGGASKAEFEEWLRARLKAKARSLDSRAYHLRRKGQLDKAEACSREAAALRRRAQEIKKGRA